MSWFIAFTILFILIGLFWGIRAYIYGNDDYWPKLGVPFVGGNVMGTFWERISVKRTFHELDNLVYKKFKSIGNVKIGGIMEFRRPVAFLMDLDLARLIMVKDFDHFVNRRQFGRKDDPTLFDKMLFSMESQEWKDMRNTLTPTFTTGKIRRMFNVFNESSDKMVTFLKNEVKTSPEIELRDVCGRYTMDVIASAAFGVDSQNFKDKNSVFAQMGYKIQDNFNGWIGGLKLLMSFQAPFLFKLFRFTFMNKTGFDFLKDVVLKSIKHRDQTGENRNDVLQLLMELRSGSVEEENEALEDTFEKDAKLHGQKVNTVTLTDDLLVAQALLFFFGGFDSIETVIMFAAYEMALNPEVQERLAAELKDAAEKNNGDLNYDVINELEYLDMVISETLRKYSPATRTERKCTRDYKVPGTNIEIKKDTSVIIPLWSIHYDPEYYPQPEKFIPERFNKENKASRHPYAYMPFGAGPRNCIAMRFAITEGKAAVAQLIHNFQLQPTARTTIPMKYLTNGSLKPVDGMWLKVIPRRK